MTWKSIDESPALPRPVAKASAWIAEAVILATLLLVWASVQPSRSAAVVADPDTNLPGTNAGIPGDVAVVPEPAPPPPLPGPVAVPVPVSNPLPAPVPVPAEPAPIRSPAAESYYREWKGAASFAARRDLDGAMGVVRKASRDSEEARRESALDLADLDRLRAFEERVAIRFSALKRGTRVELDLLDGARMSGEVISACRERVELKNGEASLFVEFPDLSWSALAKFMDDDLRAMGLAFLLDGRREQALEVVGKRRDSFEPKHWALPLPGPAPVLEPSEREARAILYDAERGFRNPATRVAAVVKYRLLLAEFASSSLVRRSMGRITTRSKAPAEIYFGAADLRGSGTFRLGKEAWTTQGAVDFAKARHSFVEGEFEAEAGASYRAFVRLSGCCTERLRVYAQASGLERPHPTRAGTKIAVEPGSIYAIVLKRPESGLPAKHVDGHPAMAGWTEIPLSASTQGGVRRIRLLTDQDGVGVSGFLVTSSRSVMPSDADLPALEATRQGE